MSGQSVSESLSEYLFLRFFNQFKCKSSAYSLSQFEEWEWEEAGGSDFAVCCSNNKSVRVRALWLWFINAFNCSQYVSHCGGVARASLSRERDEEGEAENVAWAGQICIRRWKLANGKCQLKLQPGLGRRTMINGRDFIFPFRFPLFFFLLPLCLPLFAILSIESWNCNLI